MNRRTGNCGGQVDGANHIHVQGLIGLQPAGSTPLTHRRMCAVRQHAVIRGVAFNEVHELICSDVMYGLVVR